MYTREAFDRHRRTVSQIATRETRLLAVVSVGLGIAQLIFIRWMDAHVPRNPRIAIEGAVFLVYMALVVAILWRMLRRIRVARPACPHCGTRLEGMSERVAGATGKCDRCGGQVIEPGPLSSEPRP